MGLSFYLVILCHLFLFCWLYFYSEYKHLKSGWLERFQLVKRGENLFRELSLQTPGEVGFNPPDWEAPLLRYKFYPSVIKELVDLNRKWGTPLKVPWRRLKRDLYLDLQWQKRAKTVVGETLLHQGLMSGFVLLFTWSFEALEPRSPSLIPGLIGFYTLGFGLLTFVTHILEKRVLGEGRLFWCGLIRLETFSQARLSVQETLLKSDIKYALTGEDKDFESARRLLRDAIESWQKIGHPLEETLADLREEYSFIVEQKMDLLLKRLKLVQMGMAFAFILPSFFYLLSVHMNHFLFK